MPNSAIMHPEGKPAPMAKEEGTIVIDQKGSNWSKFLQFLGPGILIAVVYVDPGQITVDMESGSVFEYKLLWALVVSNLMGLLFQHVCTRLSITTGRNLAEENRLEYPWKVRVFLWFSVELASIAADVGYVMGTAIALEILTGIPLHYGVLITGLDTFLALGLQYFGIRTVEMIVGLLFGAVLLCYLVEIFLVSPSMPGILDGLVPRAWHSNDKYGVKTWIELLCANLGAAVCPPNFFLQSALVNVRSIDRSEKSIREAFAFNLMETSLCLFLATLVNIVMLILAASEFFPERVVSLSQGADLLRNTLGDSASTAFAIAMLRRPVQLFDGRALHPVHHGGILRDDHTGMGGQARHPRHRHSSRVHDRVHLRPEHSGRPHREGPGRRQPRGALHGDPAHEVLVLRGEDGSLRPAAVAPGASAELRENACDR